MQKGITIHLAGVNAAETAHVLLNRLGELGRSAEHIDETAQKSLGNKETADLACEHSSQEGRVVIAGYPDACPSGESLHIILDPNDTPDFAAEKILDELAAAGVINLETGTYSPEEEEKVRQRLADLGYIE
ncbi:MAG: hypothetical protein HY706_07275 [Candidatus Hydrogenedentes bacterium]|nr:hypothetical protein [Candidatus Hydrogenedentota bacterium]